MFLSAASLAIRSPSHQGCTAFLSMDPIALQKQPSPDFHGIIIKFPYAVRATNSSAVLKRDGQHAVLRLCRFLEIGSMVGLTTCQTDQKPTPVICLRLRGCDQSRRGTTLQIRDGKCEVCLRNAVFSPPVIQSRVLSQLLPGVGIPESALPCGLLMTRCQLFTAPHLPSPSCGMTSRQAAMQAKNIASPSTFSS